MPDARVDAGIPRRRREELSAFVAGITLIGSVTAAPSVVERPRMRVPEVRRMRAARRRREMDRQRHESPARASAAAHETAAETRGASSALMPWPVEGAISSPFGWRRSPYGGQWEWHSGIGPRDAAHPAAGRCSKLTNTTTAGASTCS